jgi:hypothetical protein
MGPAFELAWSRDERQRQPRAEARRKRPSADLDVSVDAQRDVPLL